MHPKTKQSVDLILNDPTINQTDAYLVSHPTATRANAATHMSKLLKQPNVLAYMASKSDIAEKTIYQVLTNAKKNKESVNWQRLAKDAANDILDRVHGKPPITAHHTNINVNVEQALNSLE